MAGVNTDSENNRSVYHLVQRSMQSTKENFTIVM